MSETSTISAELQTAFDSPLPDELIDDFRFIIADYKKQYDERGFDYFAYMVDGGNELEAVERGTEAYEESLNNLKAALEEDIFAPEFEESDWWDHYTGERTALFMYPGWDFQTFVEIIESDIGDAYENYMDPDWDNEDEAAAVFSKREEVIPELVQKLLQETR